jgi:FAD/FMN-containing dehydrogenase
MIEAGDVVDAVVASSETQAAQLWKMREMLAEVYRLDGGGLTFDISVPVSSVPEFIKKASQACTQEYSAGVVMAFGHIGDGNVHFIFLKPNDVPVSDFLSATDGVSTLVYDIAASFNGSFSAEHGVGLLKKHDLVRYKSEVEIDLMKTVKKALDPNNVMNPNKVV